LPAAGDARPIAGTSPAAEAPRALGNRPLPPAQARPDGRVHQVLVVDDEAPIRDFCAFALKRDGMVCDTLGDGSAVMDAFQHRRYDLVLMDIAMPGLTGLEVCRRLRQNPPTPRLKIIMISGRDHGDELAKLLADGADDYLSKPFSVTQLLALVNAALRLKAAQDRSDLLTRHLLAVNHELEQNLNERQSDLLHIRRAMVQSLQKLVIQRGAETPAHLARMQRYCRHLAEEAAAEPCFKTLIDPSFIDLLESCVPLHDVGQVSLPDDILHKPGKLGDNERLIMQSHTTIGADLLREVAQEHPSAVGFLWMASDIARSHHERWDGAGYPDHLEGGNIPLAARIVALADMYDALRSRRVYKPGLAHETAVQVMLRNSPGHFDPALVRIFQRTAHVFDRIYREHN
jgi:response regulator RpfG family c-di-GMP phosphodiesterase